MSQATEKEKIPAFAGPWHLRFDLGLADSEAVTTFIRAENSPVISSTSVFGVSRNVMQDVMQKTGASHGA